MSPSDLKVNPSYLSGPHNQANSSGESGQQLDLSVDTGNPYDPFTMATTKILDAMMVADGAPAKQTHAQNVARDTIRELQGVHLEPLVYVGHQYLVDPLSNLVYLPVPKGPKGQQERSPGRSRNKMMGGGGGNGESSLEK